jgi:hypothetical protein
VAVIGAGVATNKIVDFGWKAVTGHEPPYDEDDPGVRAIEAIAFAAFSGAILGLMRHYAMRGASKWYGGPVDKRVDKV